MTILTIQTEFAGKASVRPRLGSMVCTNTLAEVTTAGFINNSPSSYGLNFSNGDFLFVVYGADLKGEGGTPVALVISMPSNSSIITLSVPVSDVPAYVQGITPGTSANNKAVVLDFKGGIDGVAFADMEHAGTLCALVTPGTTDGGKVLSLDESNKIDNVPFQQIINGGFIEPFYVSTLSTTPASGTCNAVFQFTDVASTALLGSFPYTVYIANSGGIPDTPVTSFSMTTGELVTVLTGQYGYGTTDGNGQIGITITAPAGTYYLTFVMSNGRRQTSSAMVVNA